MAEQRIESGADVVRGTLSCGLNPKSLSDLGYMDWNSSGIPCVRSTSPIGMTFSPDGRKATFQIELKPSGLRFDAGVLSGVRCTSYTLCFQLPGTKLEAGEYVYDDIVIVIEHLRVGPYVETEVTLVAPTYSDIKRGYSYVREGHISSAVKVKRSWQPSVD